MSTSANFNTLADALNAAVNAQSFTTIATALQAADLAANASSGGPFTIFAPTDEAFAQLPAETLADLLKPENKSQLATILGYHVVNGKVLSTDIKSGNVKTVTGDDLKVSVSGGGVTVNDASVVQADIVAGNGVVHVINKVLLPSS